MKPSPDELKTNCRRADWTPSDYEELTAWLEGLADHAYAEFTVKGTHTKYQILGVRLPLLRQIAREIHRGNHVAFLAVCDTRYFETVMLRGFVIAGLGDYDELLQYFWSQVDLIDDWSLCDSFCNSLKLARRRPTDFLKLIDTLVQTGSEFPVRVGLVLLLSHFVAEPYLDQIFHYLNAIQSDAYYVNMAEAWLLCEVVTKFPVPAQRYLEHNRLNEFTLRKAISKVRDSYRVSPELKDYLRDTYLPKVKKH